MENITGFFSSVPIDFFILGGIVIILALDSMRSGIGRTVALAVALPLSLFLYSLLSETVILKDMAFLKGSAMTQALVLAVILVLAYLLVRRMGLEYVDGGMGEPVQSVLAACAVAVIFAVVWLEIPALSEIWIFGDQVATIFAESFRLPWLIGAYAALAFARG